MCTLVGANNRLSSRAHLQVVPDSQLLDTAKQMAHAVAARESDVVRAVKHMQHEGQAFSVSNALQYELKTAASSYAKMAQTGAGTGSKLSSAFKARSRL